MPDKSFTDHVIKTLWDRLVPVQITARGFTVLFVCIPTYPFGAICSSMKAAKSRSAPEKE